METYTLQRFFSEAQVLLEKYHTGHDEGYELRASFDIEQEVAKKQPVLKCSLDYDQRDYTKRREKSVFSYGSTPAHTLAMFEEQLKVRTNHPILEKVAMEFPEEGSKS